MMAKFIAGLALGLAVGLISTCRSDELTDAADEAGVSAVDLEGALVSLHEAGIDISAHDYLFPPPVAIAPVIAACGWPICGALGQRIWCIEGIESRHGEAMWNPTAWHGEHASGWLGFLPSTARSVGVMIGNRRSEWQGAAFMLAHGRGLEFFGVASGRC